MNAKYDFKSIFIIVLAVALIISFIAGQKSIPTQYKADIERLEKTNATLAAKNDSLKTANKSLDGLICGLQGKIKINQAKLASTQSQLDNLNKKRHEIPSNVNRLSANGVANAFTKYLDKRTESSSTR